MASSGPRAPSRFKRALYMLLAIRPLRTIVCRIRWRFLKKNLHYAPSMSAGVGAKTLEHNVGAFNDDSAVFTMAGRMGTLLYPTAAVLKDQLRTARVLIVGPRTEDDIFWAKSLGLINTEGFDLFSYSPLIMVGDIHNSGIPDGTYDAVLLGWMISYSSQPERVISECKRILKPGGVLGIGLESNHMQKLNGIKPPRMNTLNSPADLAALAGLPIVFNNDPYQDVTYDCGVVFRNVTLPAPLGTV